MKFLEKEYPKGTFAKQQTDGAFINGLLATNLNVYAKRIVDDMHFLIVISGNDSVGNGKSTLATHIGAYLTNKINETHGTHNTFTAKNIALNSKNLVKQSFDNPQYSVNVLDEGDDLTTHGMKDAAVQLKRYFRKCRQLNQILILIIPSFFELPKFYALARSHCLINVKFHDDFRRGLFDFYGPKKKKKLYLKGKRDWDYDCSAPDFDGGFFSSYTFFPNLEENIKAYKKKKYDDMVDDADDDIEKLTPRQIERGVKMELIKTIHRNLPEITVRKLATGFGIGERTAHRYLTEDNSAVMESIKSGFAGAPQNTIKPIDRDDVDNEQTDL